MRSVFSRPLAVLERALLSVERFPWSALYRTAIGYSMLPLFSWLAGKGDLGWSLLPWFVAVLLALRVLPAVLRRVLPFSQHARAVWAERRALAKRFDSYQWRKLFWFGVGLAAYVASSGHIDWPSAALTGVCLGGGALGFVIWRRRVSTGLAPAEQ